MNVRIGNILLIVALVVLVVVSLFVGAYTFEKGVWHTLLQLLTNDLQMQTTDRFVLLELRLPRIAMAVLIGAALSISGASMQGLFKNPLASPDLIGITSGSMFFAAITIVLGAYFRAYIPEFLQYSLLSIASFIGAMLTMSFVYRMATKNGKTNIVILLLSGVAIAALCGAATGFLTYLSTDEELRNLTFWTLGSLGGANWTKVGILTIITIIGCIVLVKKGKALNALMLGERDAKHIGIDVERTKKQIVLCSAIMVGTSVAFAGSIGFVGLIVPYILRLLFQSNYTKILPLSIGLGAVLLLLADTFCRVVVEPSELPIGILTAFMGAPVFIAILSKTKKQL